MEIFSVNLFELHIFLSILTDEAISMELFKWGFWYCDLINIPNPHIGNVACFRQRPLFNEFHRIQC